MPRPKAPRISGLLQAYMTGSKGARGQRQQIMVQDDLLGTPLPNGMLLWFGFDFDWADLPERTPAAPGTTRQNGSEPRPGSPSKAAYPTPR